MTFPIRARRPNPQSVTEAALIAGPHGKHLPGRTHHRWGTGHRTGHLRGSERHRRLSTGSRTRQGQARGSPAESGGAALGRSALRPHRGAGRAGCLDSWLREIMITAPARRKIARLLPASAPSVTTFRVSLRRGTGLRRRSAVTARAYRPHRRTRRASLAARCSRRPPRQVGDAVWCRRVLDITPMRCRALGQEKRAKTINP